MKTGTKLEPILLRDSHHGIYIPKLFAIDIINGTIKCSNKDSFLFELGELGNPYNEQYWDAWETVERDIIIQDKYGNNFTLYSHEGDLWAIPEGYDTETFFE